VSSESERERERLLNEGPRMAPDSSPGGAGEEPAAPEPSWGGSFDVEPEKAAAPENASTWGTFEPTADAPEDDAAAREAASTEETAPSTAAKPPLTTGPLPPPRSGRSPSRRGYGYGRSPFGAGRLILPLVFVTILLVRTVHGGSSGGKVFGVVLIAAVAGAFAFWRMSRR
jgi:hypothetical protein